MFAIQTLFKFNTYMDVCRSHSCASNDNLYINKRYADVDARTSM